ncbi:MAG: DUF2156 domain-containing protein [Oscillospiraceae bacterium]
MLEFRAPQLSDRAWIYELASRSNLHSADYSFGNIYCWGKSITPMIARLGDRLLMRLSLRGKYMYSYPVGSGDLLPAVNAMMEDAEALGTDFIMRGITKDVLPEIMTLFPEEPEICSDENYADYVYLAENLANLSGRKYHGKKNHVNRFMAEHDWRFEPITPANIEACHDMASEWFVSVGDERGTDYLGEIQALHNSFDIYFDAGYDGGIIWEGDKVAAFTMGERLSSDTYDTHFEKASPHVNGAYSIINQQFAKYLLEKYPSLVYINREEDMGIENLRKAKQSYHPEFLVEKLTAVWKK